MSNLLPLFKKLFSKNEEENGFSETGISQAEERLATTLPKGLREFYLTQARNQLINSSHSFIRPEHLFLDNSQWLSFYSENQGIWTCAIHLHDRHPENPAIYVNYEQQGYELEASSLADFFIVRASCDYGSFIYPYRMRANNLSLHDIEAIVKKSASPKSDICPPNYPFRRRLFWKSEDEVVRIFEFSGETHSTKNSISVQSLDQGCIDRYLTFFANINWEIEAQGTTDSQTYLPSYLDEDGNI